MTEAAWTIDNSDGELTLHTGVAGRAARMGHRLTIRMDSWRITAEWAHGKPVSGHLVVDVDSLQVISGEGGVTPLSGPEKGVARANALKTLDAKHCPTIEFDAEEIIPADDGYLLRGPLRIQRVTKPVEVLVAAHQDAGTWSLSCRQVVVQSEFGVKPFSMMMGSLKVADEVTVAFEASFRP